MIDNIKILDRIKKLVIPPAWKMVQIANSSKDKIQCIGIDDKNRKQYKYNPEYIKEQTINKYYKCLIKFGKKINIIREDVEKLLRENKSWNLEKTLAFIILILDKCHLRVGNEIYKETNMSYGITTLEKRHIIIKTNKVYLNFVGKKNVENSCVFEDKEIVKLFKSLYKKFNHKENESFFKYINNNGDIYNITSSHINDFLKNYGRFSAKNFRTWGNELIIIYLLNNIKEINNNE